MKRILLINLVLVFGMYVSAQALPIPDPLDPAVLHIGNPPNSGTYLFGSEVQSISSTMLGILENGSGQPTLVNPLLLILGVPNMTSANFTAPTITLSHGTGTIGGTNVFSGDWNTATGYAGNFASGDVYDFITLAPSGNASNTFGNWSAAELAVNNITASGFGIFVYKLAGTGLTGGGLVDVTFSSPLPTGTFAVAYGQDSRRQPHSFTTPFTEAGLVNKVPEPSTFILLGSGILFVFFGRKKIK